MFIAFKYKIEISRTILKKNYHQNSCCGHTHKLHFKIVHTKKRTDKQEQNGSNKMVIIEKLRGNKKETVIKLFYVIF